MDNRKRFCLITGGILAVAGTLLGILCRPNTGDSFPPLFFSLGLILAIVGIALMISGLLPKKQKTSAKTLCMASLFAALCYVGFEFFRIDIPVGDSSTAFHLGNVFCVLGALFLGGTWGGMAGAVGMTIADLMIPAYIVSAPKTFLLKLGIGLITGFVAHKVFHVSQERSRKIPLPAAAAISAGAGMLFNIVADPLVGYFYKMYVLGVPQDAAAIWMKMGAVTTAVNAVIATIAAAILYTALRPALKRTGLMPEI